MNEVIKKNLKVLFLVRQYAPIPKVCEICVKRLRKSLFDIGVYSDVLQYTGKEGIVDNDEYGTVFSVGAGEAVVNTTEKSAIRLFFRRASVAYRFPFYFNYKVNSKYRDKMKELCQREKYDAVIGVTLPVDTAYAGVDLDNFILYELDAITNTPQNRGRIKSLYKRRIENIEKKIFGNASLIIHMECNREYFHKRKYEPFRLKSTFTDIPNLVEFSQNRLARNDEKMLFAYFGSLSRDMRNPEYLIRLIEATCSSVSAKYEFYSRGNCEDLLENAEKNNPGVIQRKGYVTPDEVEEVQGKADFLLSIGNKLSGEDRSLPSKILEYIAIGKPIIHICGGSNDSAISYLEKYGLACIIDPNDNFEDSINKYVNFVKNNRGKTVSFKTVKGMFPKNTPEYTANIILNHIEAAR